MLGQAADGRLAGAHPARRNGGDGDADGYPAGEPAGPVPPDTGDGAGSAGGMEVGLIERFKQSEQSLSLFKRKF